MTDSCPTVEESAGILGTQMRYVDMPINFGALGIWIAEARDYAE